MQLREFQERFKTLMLEPSTSDLEGVFAGDNLSTRLDIYRNNILSSLSAVMAETFPAICKLVGEAFFETMARRFITQHPPHSGCLNDYGTEFDSFIKTYAPANTLPYLTDMAKLEFALHRAYHAPDDIPLQADQLAAIKPEALENLHLNLRASAFLIESPYALDEIHEFCFTPEQTPPQLEKQTYLLIHRPHLTAEIIPLEPVEHALLSALAEGSPLGPAVEAVLQNIPTFDFPAFLQKHTGLGTFRAFSAIPP